MEVLRRLVDSAGPEALTERHQRGDDGHGQRSREEVDAPGQEGDLPHAGVPQADDVGVGVVHLDVALDASLGREGAADLSRQTREPLPLSLGFVSFRALRCCFLKHTQIAINENNQAAGSISVLVGPTVFPVLF